MDVVLGIAVTGPVARLALVGSDAAGQNVIDQSAVDLAGRPVEALTETVVGTNRLLAGESHRLVATRVCWTDRPKADRLRRALEDSGVHNVGVLTGSQAAAALMRAAGRPGAVLVMDDATATVSIVDPGAGEASNPTGAEATATFDTVMATLGERPDAPRDLYLVGAHAELTQMAEQLRDASTMRVEVAEDPTFALARGAAFAAAPLAGGPDATALAPALTGDRTTIVPASQYADGQQLAYSMAGDEELLAADYDDYDEYDDYEAETGPLKLSRRSLVIGNTVIAFAVIGFASLAVAVAVAVRPVASSQPVVGHQNAAPGKFMPLLPTQQQAPVPAPPVDAPNAGYQGGTIPDSNGYIPPQLTSPGGGAPVAPAPVAPPVPGVRPNPVVPAPIPVPVPVPYPGWQPNRPPYYPPTTTYSPPTAPPTTSYSPPTTTAPLPPTTTAPSPPTTTAPTTQTTEPSTSTHTPPTTTQTAAPPTTSKPAPTTQTSVAPSTQPTQHTQTQAPVTPKPATPQEPRSGGSPGGGGPHR